MKTLLLSSSPRKEKSQTFLLAKEVVRGLSDEAAQCDVVHLYDCRIEFCRHCEACHKKILKCPIKDDVREIVEKMLEASGIIIASPNYINQVTANMKALFDRSSHFIHCKRLLDKYIVSVVSSGSGQDKPVLDYIRYYGHVCGAQYTGGVSSRAPVSRDKLEEAFRLGNRLAADVTETRAYPEQMRIIEEGKKHFGRIMQIRKQEWSEEYQYWKDKGWL